MLRGTRCGDTGVRAGEATVGEVVASEMLSSSRLPGSGAGVPDGPVQEGRGLLASVFRVHDDELFRREGANYAEIGLPT